MQEEGEPRFYQRRTFENAAERKKKEKDHSGTEGKQPSEVQYISVGFTHSDKAPRPDGTFISATGLFQKIGL